ncbi:hypothetical protein [Paenibacillus sp. GYB003]|uniref:hypothetical protein n=1 Tax=Paenibacillus sp. GYB003 TaxID=2994392 RepID=UPI002F96AF21
MLEKLPSEAFRTGWAAFPREGQKPVVKRLRGCAYFGAVVLPDDEPVEPVLDDPAPPELLEEPEEPVEPDEPEDDPEEPVEPVEPEDPDEPVEPEDPVELLEPVEPELPDLDVSVEPLLLPPDEPLVELPPESGLSVGSAPPEQPVSIAAPITPINRAMDNFLFIVNLLP